MSLDPCPEDVLRLRGRLVPDERPAEAAVGVPGNRDRQTVSIAEAGVVGVDRIETLGDPRLRDAPVVEQGREPLEEGELGGQTVAEAFEPDDDRLAV